MESKIAQSYWMALRYFENTFVVKVMNICLLFASNTVYKVLQLIAKHEIIMY